ncbi:DUF6069 family protein [Streptosporangium longisporum]|uniref:Uncharacterized protein n=1 Tax=Streptosporangium longisporum TaxID=46187 RepID=A0ABN3Y524_9ACTN
MTGTASVAVAPRLRRGALAVAGAVLSTVLVWAAAHALGVELRVDPRNGRPPGVIDLPFAAMVTLAVSLLGWGARALLQRVTRRAPAVWTVLALTVLIVSFLPVFMVGATGATRVTLAAMHLAVAAVLVPVFGRRTS